ncbi:unnamed protein product [Hanseniaspora opuntiae]
MDTTSSDKSKAKRIVAKRACLNCRSKKIKCDGEVTVFLEGKSKCSNCSQNNLEGCIFLPSKRGGRKPKGKVNKNNKTLKQAPKMDDHLINSSHVQPVYSQHPPIGPNNQSITNFPHNYVQHGMPPIYYNMIPFHPHMHPNVIPPFQQNKNFNQLPTHVMNPNKVIPYFPPNIHDPHLHRRSYSNINSERSYSNCENTPIDQPYHLPSVQNFPNFQQSYRPKGQMFPQQGFAFNSKNLNTYPQNQDYNSNAINPINHTKFLEKSQSLNNLSHFNSAPISPRLPSFSELNVIANKRDKSLNADKSDLQGYQKQSDNLKNKGK